MGVREKFSFFRFPPITKRRQIGHEHDTRPNPPKRPDTRIREPVRLWTKSDLPSGAQNQIFFQVPTLCESNIRNDLAHPPSLAQRIQSKSPLEVLWTKSNQFTRGNFIFSRARNRRRRDARGVGISRTSIEAPASPLGPKFSRVRVAGTIGTNLAETAHGHAGVDRVPEPSPQTTRGQRRAADDVGASLATARPPPMREQPRGVSHGSLASRSY